MDVIMGLLSAYLGWAVVISWYYRARYRDRYATALNAFPRALAWPIDLYDLVQKQRGRAPKPEATVSSPNRSLAPQPTSARERGLMHIRCDACQAPNDVYSPHETCYACGAGLMSRTG
jgi:hypothetical protein